MHIYVCMYVCTTFHYLVESCSQNPLYWLVLECMHACITGAVCECAGHATDRLTLARWDCSSMTTNACHLLTTYTQ